MSDKFCVDCRHHGEGSRGHLCGRIIIGVSRVTGKPEYKSLACWEERERDAEGRCGISGQYWEPK